LGNPNAFGVFFVSFDGVLFVGFNRAGDSLNVVLPKKTVSALFQTTLELSWSIDISAVDVGHVTLGENHHVIHLERLVRKQGTEPFDVGRVLEHRRIHLVLGMSKSQNLGPTDIAVFAVDPSRIVFRFHYKDSFCGHQNVIDLGGFAIIARDNDIVDENIVLVHGFKDVSSHYSFALPPFDRRKVKNQDKGDGSHEKD
jgi:hypothetical protein